MEYLVSASEMRDCDQCIIRKFGVPSMVLMERAALACTELLVSSDFDLSRVLIVAGSGNNGGDGFAMARLLYLRGMPVDVWFVGNPEHLTEEAAAQKKICENYGINFVRNPVGGEYTTIVDAIFGSGLSREVTGTYRQVIEFINTHPAKVFSVDIPSGIRSDDGSVAGSAVQAELTGALAFRKIGHVLYPGAQYSGKVVRLDIGITREGFQDPGKREGGKKIPKIATVTREDFQWLPPRTADSNKGTFGKACLVAGSKNMCGAAYLSGKAAYLTGTGLVKIISQECNREILQTLLPEAVLGTMEGFQETILREAFSWASAVAVGPGLSTEKWAKDIVKNALALQSTPLVLDADGLNILAGHLDWLQGVKHPVVLTPHLGEMARLTGLSIEEIKLGRLSVAKEFAKKHHVILVLKDARTIITDGKLTFINDTGNSGMATGGSGDVLTGIITGLLAQHMEPLRAAAFGVYLHALAGDQASKQKGEAGMLSGDLLESLPIVWKEGQRENGKKL